MNKIIYAIGIVIACAFVAYTKIEKPVLETKDSPKIENIKEQPLNCKTDSVNTSI